jgi:toxin-antitoxin system PIN domain toxin
MAYLLDVNVLVALFDGGHIHHSAAHEWFERVSEEGWATSPITENGLLRILSHPAYPHTPLPIEDLAERFEEFKKSSTNYQFWTNDYSMSAWIFEEKITVSSSQSTDAYLLKLCSRNEGRLATFDRRIKPSLIGETSDRILQYIPV